MCMAYITLNYNLGVLDDGIIKSLCCGRGCKISQRFRLGIQLFAMQIAAAYSIYLYISYNVIDCTTARGSFQFVLWRMFLHVQDWARQAALQLCSMTQT